MDRTVWVTYMEIYNENVYDLLDQPPDKSKNEVRYAAAAVAIAMVMGIAIVMGSSACLLIYTD